MRNHRSEDVLEVITALLVVVDSEQSPMLADERIDDVEDERLRPQRQIFVGLSKVLHGIAKSIERSVLLLVGNSGRRACVVVERVPALAVATARYPTP